jgi:thioredoxin
VRDVTDATFDAEVLQAQNPVVVDFWAPWCGPCHAIAPVLEQLAAEHTGRIEFVKLNIDQNVETASRYDVLSIPTTILFEGGEARETVLGARPRSHFERAFGAWLAPPAPAAG